MYIGFLLKIGRLVVVFFNGESISCLVCGKIGLVLTYKVMGRGCRFENFIMGGVMFEEIRGYLLMVRFNLMVSFMWFREVFKFI